MLDIRLIREQPDIVKHGLERIGADVTLVDQVLALDEERRRIETVAGEMRNRRNVGSKKIGAMNEAADREALKDEMRELGDRISEIESQLDEINARQQALMLGIPNLPDPRVPDGTSDDDNVLIRSGGEQRSFDFTPRPHWEVGANLGILDIERGVKISGSRFYVLLGAGAALQRALITWFLDLHITRHGYTEVYPPFIVKSECLIGTGQLPKFADTMYRDAEEDFWLVPTAEVPVTNLHRDEILDDSVLPIKYVAYTPCFRREKMSAGRDVRGIKRGHQFDKVEMVRICRPSDSDAALDDLVNDAEDICKALDVPYRTVLVCTAEKTATNRLQYDLQMYAPGVGEWLEVSSCSNFGDYQARRANIRYRPEGGGKPEFVHTLNGSGLALPRVVISILENYQNADGSVTVPEVLRPYMRGCGVITN